MDIAESDRFEPAPDITASVMEGEAALLNVRTGAYFGLNAVGTFLWNSYAEGKTFGEAVQAVCKEFAVTPDVARRDAAAFTQKTLTRGLLQAR
ncbi:MAG: PqqD family protein [Kiritimatiellae bacterium]|nr:PqqD family protein [Kiritimatiellia bacterium]